MMQKNQMLGLSAFTAYFVMDAMTTCIGVYLYGIGAESNPAMFATIGSLGLAGFIALKLALSLCIILPSYALSAMPGTRIMGNSALIAITTGGVLAAANNATVLLMGNSIFYAIIGDRFIGGGTFIGLSMLLAGAMAYFIMSARVGRIRVPNVH